METALGRRGGLPLSFALGVLLLAGCRHGCPFCGHDQGGTETTPAVTSAAPADPFGGQRTCPVSGARLGANGPAVPVTVNGQTMYVCCAKCAAKVQADPDPYLAKVASERTGSGRVSTAGPYGGQKHCPVTGEELDPDGGAIPVMVRGETIYVCCGGCARKVKSNPDAYLAKVRAERSSRAAAGY